MLKRGALILALSLGTTSVLSAEVVVCSGKTPDGLAAKVVKYGFHPTADCQLWIYEPFDNQGWIPVSGYVDCKGACSSIGETYGGGGGGEGGCGWLDLLCWVRKVISFE